MFITRDKMYPGAGFTILKCLIFLNSGFCIQCLQGVILDLARGAFYSVCADSSVYINTYILGRLERIRFIKENSNLMQI